MYGAIGKIGGSFGRLPGANRAGNLFRGLMGVDKASVGVGALLYGSQKAQDILDRSGFTPTRDDLRRMSEGVVKQGKNYNVGGVEYDFRTGRPINAPPSTFIPYEDDTLQAGQFATPPSSGAPRTSVVVSNGAGVPAQRQNVEQRSLSQEVLNAAQQYAAPTGVPLSSFYEGQQQLGRSMMQKGTLVNELQSLGGATGMDPTAFKQWAQANPGLAYRELLKLRQNPTPQ